MKSLNEKAAALVVGATTLFAGVAKAQEPSSQQLFRGEQLVEKYDGAIEAALDGPHEGR